MQDKSLEEVVQLLTPRAAQLIADDQAGVQQYVIEIVRTFLSYWEELGVVLDPIQLSVVVESIVAISRAQALLILDQNCESPCEHPSPPPGTRSWPTST